MSLLVDAMFCLSFHQNFKKITSIQNLTLIPTASKMFSFPWGGSGGVGSGGWAGDSVYLWESLALAKKPSSDIGEVLRQNLACPMETLVDGLPY